MEAGVILNGMLVSLTSDRLQPRRGGVDHRPRSSDEVWTDHRRLAKPCPEQRACAGSPDRTGSPQALWHCCARSGSQTFKRLDVELTTMGDVVDLKPVNLAENHDFVADCCRFQEGILTEANMKLKYRFADSIWEKLGDNEGLLEAVEAEKVRRIRTGQQKRERAQVLVTKAPDVVSAIMLDPAANARHRIDAAASLDKFAANPADSMPTTSDRFIITINLGADHVEHYNKSISINADDVAPSDIEVEPTHTGYKPVTHEGLPDKRPIKTIEHEPGRVEKTPEQVALEAMMNRGWEY
jgi:hypothetical protein